MVERVLDRPNGVLFGSAAREPAHRVGQLNVPHEFVAGVDQAGDALHNSGARVLHALFRYIIGELGVGAHFLQQLGARAPANHKLSRNPIKFQPVEVKQLLAEVVLHVDGRHHQYFFRHAHVGHVVAHFFRHADGGTRFARSEAVIQEQAVVRGHHRQEVAHKELVRSKLKRGAAHFGGFFLHLTLGHGDHHILPGVVELLALRNVPRKVGIAFGWIQESEGLLVGFLVLIRVLCPLRYFIGQRSRGCCLQQL